MSIATCTYGHVLPGAVPVHAKSAAPRSSTVKIAYKPKPETFSDQVVRLMSSRPREKVVVYKSKPCSYGYSYDEASYPVVINNVSGKCGQFARLERRLNSTERPISINNRIHTNRRSIYERERRLPPQPVVLVGPDTYRTVSVSPGPPRSHSYSRPRVHFSDDVYAPPRHHSYSRPRVHFSEDIHAPNIIEVTHADDE